LNGVCSVPRKIRRIKLAELTDGKVEDFCSCGYKGSGHFKFTAIMGASTEGACRITVARIWAVRCLQSACGIAFEGFLEWEMKMVLRRICPGILQMGKDSDS